MKPLRRSSTSSVTLLKPSPLRTPARLTTEDIQAANLRRWDGAARITTDWVNLFQEPELCFADGDLLIYLREPGQSSRPPAFRVHKAYLKEKGFAFLLDRCISRPPVHPGYNCMLSSCYGCEVHPSPSELYVPAPADAELDEICDHHITTRNFFAWIYNLPLAGRALGRSMVTLRERIDYYRPHNEAQSSLEIVSFAESQGYLDFRECIDHALAALLLAEYLQIEDLWIDAFVHCVGMCHRGLNSSLEYLAISYETRLLIQHANRDMNAQVKSVRQSVNDFFEYDLSSHFLGLSQAARDHFDRFRSWLHSYHIEQHGFWPPDGFHEEQTIEREVYASMYFDFKNLYYHLVDPESSTGMGDLHTSASGGVCVAQTVQALDARHEYESLPNTMPMLPAEPEMEMRRQSTQRRKSWNPISWRKLDKDKKKALRVQALITASNRDWIIMDCPLVRRYSEFESETIIDDYETISMVEGRKIRWILIYAILQTLVSVMQTPDQVRNGDGLSYLLCCRPPTRMPWQSELLPQPLTTTKKTESSIEPDTQYVQSSTPSSEAATSKPHLSLKQLQEKRRQSMPARITRNNSRPTLTRSISIKKLIGTAEIVRDNVPAMPKSHGFCEILVPGYGNGLNEVDSTVSDAKNDLVYYNSRNLQDENNSKRQSLSNIVTVMQASYASTGPGSASSDGVPDLSPTSSASISRESSIASTHGAWSTSGIDNTYDIDVVRTTSPISSPDLPKPIKDKSPVPRSAARPLSTDLNHIFDEEGFLRTVHFNTQTWDDFLQVSN